MEQKKEYLQCKFSAWKKKTKNDTIDADHLKKTETIEDQK